VANSTEQKKTKKQSVSGPRFEAGNSEYEARVLKHFATTVGEERRHRNKHFPTVIVRCTKMGGGGGESTANNKRYLLDTSRTL
jgi:hypothetical protein